MTDSPGTYVDVPVRELSATALGSLADALGTSWRSCAARESGPTVQTADAGALLRAPGRSSCRRAARGTADCGGAARSIPASPAIMPACGPPSSLSPLKDTRSDARLDALGDERLVDAERLQVDDAAAAEVLVQRQPRSRAERREFARFRAIR